VKVLLLAFGLTLSLHAQNITVLLPSTNILPPSTNTPPYVWWVNWTNQYGGTKWVVQGGQTRDYCWDVTITWTTLPGLSYSVETSWLNGQGWVTLLPPTPSGTNRIMGFRTGTKYSSHFFRVRQW